MIVTMHRSSDPADPLTDVYVTPGMSVDCAQLGEAAVQFKDNFDHLLNPQRWWSNTGKGNPEYTCEMERVVVDPLDRQDGWQRGMAGRHRSVLEAVFHGGPGESIKKKRCKVFSNADLDIWLGLSYQQPFLTSSILRKDQDRKLVSRSVFNIKNFG